MPQPPLVINPLPAPPVPPGLFSVATPAEMPPHGENGGAIWTPDTCGIGDLYAAPCQAPPYPAFNTDAFPGVAQAFPFIATVRLVVGGAGWDAQEIQRRATLLLNQSEQSIAEKALWGGNATLFTGINIYAGTIPPAAPAAGVAGGVFQQLAAAGAPAGFFDLTAETAPNVAEAVAALEQSLADNYTGQGIIHARPRIAAYAGKNNQFRVVGLPKESSSDNQYTQNWNAWSFGNGYTGIGKLTTDTPTVTPADGSGTEYMWATGRVICWRDPVATVDMSQVFDRQLNQRYAYAWRPYMIGVECFSACIKVTRA